MYELTTFLSRFVELFGCSAAPNEPEPECNDRRLDSEERSCSEGSIGMEGNFQTWTTLFGVPTRALIARDLDGLLVSTLVYASYAANNITYKKVSFRNNILLLAPGHVIRV